MSMQIFIMFVKCTNILFDIVCKMYKHTKIVLIRILRLDNKIIIKKLEEENAKDIKDNYYTRGRHL